MKMSIERVRNNTDRVELKYWKKTYYSAKFCPPPPIFFETNPGIRVQRSATNSLSHETASYRWQHSDSINSQPVPYSKTLHLGYNKEPDVAVWGNIFCLFWELYETRKHTVMQFL